jgi:hypothetical protein
LCVAHSFFPGGLVAPACYQLARAVLSLSKGRVALAADVISKVNQLAASFMLAASHRRVLLLRCAAAFAALLSALFSATHRRFVLPAALLAT